MKAPQPLDKGSSNPHGPGKKQKPEKAVMVPLPVTEVANLQAQKPDSTTVTAGSANPYSNRMNLNGTIAPVHGSRTIYDKGAEIRYGKFQESLAETGDINHPETKKLETSYIATLSISQIRDYHNLKNGTYLPKTLEEQAAAYQEKKIQKEAQPKAKPAGSGNADDALADLSHAPATKLAAHFNIVQDSSAGLFNHKAEKAAHGLPRVNAKSGSAFTGSKPKRKAGPAKKTAKPGKKTIQPAAQKPRSKEISFAQNESLKKTSYAFNATGKTGGLEKQAQNQLDHIQLDTSAIPAAMQQDTRVQLTGEADTQHLAIEQQEATHDMGIHKDHAESDIHKDYGENDIIKKPKDEILKPSRKISAKAVKKQPLETLKLEGIDEAGINAQFAPVIRTKIGAENEKYKAAELEHDQKVLEQEKTAETEIGTEKDRSHEKQLKTVKDARSDVHRSRIEWQQALDKTEADFARKSGDHTKATLGHIKTEKSRGETTAQGHVDKANAETRKKKEAAQAEARQKKAEQQKASGGFFGWVADKASAFINALKDALNYIFTRLRDAVKAIFEAAKTLVLAALELARKAIVSLIKAFASVIKSFLDIALAAFPGIRDRLKARIDKYVAVAEKLVNQAFEAFKKAVVAVIDFLAETVDKLLSILQFVYEGILTVVGMIVKGDILALLEKLGNIKDALFGVTFDTIKQGGMEELLGANLDESLSPEELIAAMQMGLLSGGNEQGSDDGMPKAPWTNANVGVDVVSFEELSPEMQAELKRMQKAGQTEATIGERNDPSRTMSSVMEEARTSQSAPEVSGQKFNDGLTPMKRAEIKWEMMKTGIKQWWDKNWLKVVGGIIAALVVFIAAEVVTGGAITAALPVIMPILADVFIGVTIAQLATHFVDGLAKSWAGEIKGGTKAFSRGLAAALIELAMYLGFKLVEVAAKAITQLVKGGIKLIKAGARSVMNFSKFIIKEGKVLFKGMAGKNLGKLSKSLRKLGDDILERTRLKKIRIRLEGRRFFIEGFINPWVLMAEGNLKEISDELAKGKKLGDDVEGGILVGIKGSGKTSDGSAFVKALGESAQTSEGLAKNAKRFEDLKNIQDLATRNTKILQGGKGVARDPNFRKNFFSMLENFGLKLSENAKKFIAVHHIAPNFLKGKQKIADFITHMGYNIDAVENAIGLPRIDLNILDDAIKGLDESIDVVKNTKHLESIKTTLKLGDDIDIKELRRIVKELEDAKTASVHAVDTYHPAFNKMMETKIFEMSKDFDDLIKSGMSKNEVIDLYKPEFKNFYNSVVDDLLNGKIKL